MSIGGGRKRALVVVGAGASKEFGAPTTAELTDTLADRIAQDEWMQRSGADKAFEEIRNGLAGHYRNGGADVNFEQVFHCAHELLFSFAPDDAAVNEYRPTLYPFLERKFVSESRALKALLGGMTRIIYQAIVDVCQTPRAPLAPLARFIERLRSDHITRVYTTNYDDFILQAAPDLFTGFAPRAGSPAGHFDERGFWKSADRDCAYYLHGSVHLGFSNSPDSPRMSELLWHEDRNEAQRHADRMGSGIRRMDGSHVDHAAIITGLDKLSRLQQAPFSYFYSELARDALQADVIFVLGCGLGDLHINNWLHEARLQSDHAPIILVDYWAGGFAANAAFNEIDRKMLEIWHSLRMPIGYEPAKTLYPSEGWAVNKERSCAVWGNGFQAFLNAPDDLETVLAMLTLG